MAKRFFLLACLIGMQIFAGLSLHSKELTFDFTFSKDYAGWVGDFADYDVNQETFFELGWAWTNLPSELAFNGLLLNKGMLLTGNNHSDDLFMFIKRRIEGLKPNTSYDLTFFVAIEDNIPPGLIGIGGSPGESVYFKVGASKVEPRKVADGTIYRLNVDKGNQSQGGKNAVVVGNLANPLVNPFAPLYQPKYFTNEIPLRVKTDHAGRLWLFLGTDSGFEGPTTYYIAFISVLATPRH
ncbi:hypothetical protein [Candidatus Protochlamydia phocaeensis]|uniref:hypothetical protein n=1 Tax=Candidatus Protochlamydia phocaeensis TaxID=1414722 RepID=UPI000838EB68|nr:hypothetical protein [Candidatus Protochlamydia phocaeensis]